MTPITKKISKSILESIETDKIIYAEVTPPGAMGNSGGIIIYIKQNNSNEMLCYETSIYDDEQTYLLVEEKLFKHIDREDENSNKEQLYFDFYYGGMGNNVFINKKINLSIQDNYFIYQADDLEFQIFSSVQGVFDNVVNQMNSNKSTKLSLTKRISQKWIDKLEDNEIFVFGSNLDGLHGGGAAAVARKWGAIWGQGVGLQGQTYAIPTMQGGVETIEPYVDEFLTFAKSRPNLKFLVTEIGCGIAGFTVEQIAPLFKNSLDENIENIFLPESFYKILTNEKTPNR
ncbi:hypothetical protein SAMN04487990_12029 [Bizionia paragorgiae]|uniref:Uncharacterized protein n=2 Tax=Bizionia paragorgiae TaxID=283786 RepID=A0A1H4CJN0_BIZPA|nr:hypothetical protein SAMN04487990_12029 [Bizionia paragorgiae]